MSLSCTQSKPVSSEDEYFIGSEQICCRTRTRAVQSAVIVLKICTDGAVSAAAVGKDGRFGAGVDVAETGSGCVVVVGLDGVAVGSDVRSVGLDGVAAGLRREACWSAAIRCSRSWRRVSTEDFVPAAASESSFVQPRVCGRGICAARAGVSSLGGIFFGWGTVVLVGSGVVRVWWAD